MVDPSIITTVPTDLAIVDGTRVDDTLKGRPVIGVGIPVGTTVLSIHSYGLERGVIQLSNHVTASAHQAFVQEPPHPALLEIPLNGPIRYFLQDGNGERQVSEFAYRAVAGQPGELTDFEDRRSGVGEDVVVKGRIERDPETERAAGGRVIDERNPDHRRPEPRWSSTVIVRVNTAVDHQTVWDTVQSAVDHHVASQVQASSWVVEDGNAGPVSAVPVQELLVMHGWRREAAGSVGEMWVRDGQLVGVPHRLEPDHWEYPGLIARITAVPGGGS